MQMREINERWENLMFAPGREYTEYVYPTSFHPILTSSRSCLCHLSQSTQPTNKSGSQTTTPLNPTHAQLGVSG